MTCQKNDCGFYRERHPYCALRPDKNVEGLQCEKCTPSDCEKLARELLIDSLLHIDKFNIGMAKDLIHRAIDMLEKA
jgi:hypothetical protein